LSTVALFEVHFGDDFRASEMYMTLKSAVTLAARNFYGRLSGREMTR